jgi:hypothetical protein
MVSISAIILIGGLALFVLAGGVGISKVALGQIKTDFSMITGGISERVKGITGNKIDTQTNPMDKAGEMIF